MIRILLADDHPVVREGLAAMLGTQPDFEIAGEAGDGPATVSAAALLRPDVVLMDIEIPPTDGIKVAEELLQRDPATKVLMFTAFDSHERIVGALGAGAHGYLLKGVPREELFAAIRTVAAGGSHLQSQVAARLIRHVGIDPRPELTSRQAEVLALLARGATNKEIAVALRVGERTVKYHVTAIFDRLHAGNRTEAVAIALQLGLVRSPSSA